MNKARLKRLLCDVGVVTVQCLITFGVFLIEGAAWAKDTWLTLREKCRQEQQ